MYVFTVDGREVAPRRSSFKEAAVDAVLAGYASWERGRISVYLDDALGADIKRISQSVPRSETDGPSTSAR